MTTKGGPSPPPQPRPAIRHRRWVGLAPGWVVGDHLQHCPTAVPSNTSLVLPTVRPWRTHGRHGLPYTVSAEPPPSRPGPSLPEGPCAGHAAKELVPRARTHPAGDSHRLSKQAAVTPTPSPTRQTCLYLYIHKLYYSAPRGTRMNMPPTNNGNPPTSLE